MATYSPREAQKDFLYTKLASLLLSLLVTGGIAVWGFKQGVEYGLISLSPAHSDGRIVRVEGKADTVRLVFEFEDNSYQDRQGETLQRRQFALPLSPGDRVGVLYLSFYPAVAQIERQLSRQAISFYILLGCFLVHIATVVLIRQTCLQIQKHARDDFYY